MLEKTGSDAAPSEIIDFLEDNNWFGERPDFSGGKVLLDKIQVEELKGPVTKFLSCEATAETLLSDLKGKCPVTAKLFSEFMESMKADTKKNFGVSEDDVYHIADFLLTRLYKELPDYTNADTETLIKQVTEDLTKARGDILVFFLDWLRDRTRTKYTNSYMLERRTPVGNLNAYDKVTFLSLVYFLTNEEYISDKEMYIKAAESKKYADIWLYLAFHLVAALRLTDLERIYHPTLSRPPEVVLSEIRSGTFSDADAIRVLESVNLRMNVLKFNVSKTGRAQARFSVPTDCEIHYGTLLAIAEAHSRLADEQDQPLIRRVSEYRTIKRVMGDDIGRLFLERNFSGRSANKSYLQAITRDDGFANNEDTAVLHYNIAAHARSHTGGRGAFISATTSVYLQDGKFSGMNSEDIAYEFLQRGVLSFAASDLFKLIPSLGYESLPHAIQTEVHQELGITPYEAESLVSVVSEARAEARATAIELCRTEAEDSLIDALVKIDNGQAFAKDSCSYCLLSAVGRKCEFPDRRNCVACKYEILTKSTLWYLKSEYTRLQELFSASDDDRERTMLKHIATEKILPKISEMLTCMKEQYPEEIYKAYLQIVKEDLHV